MKRKILIEENDNPQLKITETMDEVTQGFKEGVVFCIKLIIFVAILVYLWIKYSH